MFRCNNQYIIDNLHNNIEELIINETNLNLDNLPNSVKYIYIKYYNKELNNYDLKIKKF